MTTPIAASRRALAFLAVLTLAAAPARAAERIAFEFVGGVAFMPVMRAHVDAELEDGGYAGEVTFRSAGLVGFFKPARVEGRGAGRVENAGLAPETYTHLEINGRKRREVRLAYEPGDVRVTAEPPFGSLGDPAPTPAQKAEGLDPLSMILTIALDGGDEPCSRVVPVFDSKLRYDLEFHPDGHDDDLRTRGYRGPAERCEVFYRPIAGYDAEDLADDDVYATPIHVWLAEVAPGVTAPVLIRSRFRAAILPFTVTLELKRAEVDPS